MAVSSAPRPKLVGRLLGGLLLGVAVYYAVWGGEYSAFDLRRLSRQQGEERARLALAHQAVDSLRRVAGRLESDPATIEQVARERFGMIRPGEVLYRFVPVDSAGAPPHRIARTP